MKILVPVKRVVDYNVKIRVRPDGSGVDHVPLSDPFTTNVCFGGPDLTTAYVTLSGTGKLVAFDWPRPGLKLNFTA